MKSTKKEIYSLLPTSYLFPQAMRELGMKSTKKEIYKLFNDLE